LLPGGHPYYIGKTPRFPFTYRCHRCNRKTTLTASGWAMLPQVAGQIETGVKPAPVVDLTGKKATA
jgi:hypothetical protein